jgi:hypothetical protein
MPEKMPVRRSIADSSTPQMASDGHVAIIVGQSAFGAPDDARIGSTVTEWDESRDSPLSRERMRTLRLTLG